MVSFGQFVEIAAFTVSLSSFRSLSPYSSLSLSLSPTGVQPAKKQQPAKGGKTQGKGKDAAGKKPKPTGSGGKAKKKVRYRQSHDIREGLGDADLLGP